MNRRLAILLTIVATIALFAYVEYAFFSVFRPAKAVFLQISILAVACTLGTVLARNLVHAALFLVGFFFSVACQFVLLEAEFLAAMQVLVYIGAVAVILMFGIMLTRNIQGDDTTVTPWRRKILPAAASLALLSVLCYGIVKQRASGPGDLPFQESGRVWGDMVYRPIVGSRDNLTRQGVVINDMPRSLGEDLMTRWVIPFEIAGLLLTAALVGAVALARIEEPSEDSGADGSKVARRGGNLGTDGNGDAAPSRPAPAASSTY